MPIAQTTVAAGDLITHAIVTGNLQALEAYMLGKVPASDLVNLIRKRSGLNDQEHLVWASVPFESGLGIETRSDWDATGNPAIDKTSIIDFLYRGKPLKGWIAGTPWRWTLGWLWDFPPFETQDGPTQLFLHERMGSFPSPGQGSPPLVNSPFSMYDWRYTAEGGLPDVEQAVSSGTIAYGRYKDRFPAGEIWELWKTVPYASMVIYVPEPCRLYVNAVARGTWNLCAMGGGSSPAEINWVDLDQNFESQDPPTVFRLFISKNPGSTASPGAVETPFTWKSGAHAYVANWSPIQPLDIEPNVAYGELSKSGGDASKKFNVGREWMASTWPRGIIRVASEIYVPKAGYYTIALKFNTLHWYGVFSDTGVFTKRYMSIFGGDGSDGAGQRIIYGPSLVCRWEAAAISATAQRKRTGSASDYTSVQFP